MFKKFMAAVFGAVFLLGLTAFAANKPVPLKEPVKVEKQAPSTKGVAPNPKVAACVKKYGTSVTAVWKWMCVHAGNYKKNPVEKMIGSH